MIGQLSIALAMGLMYPTLSANGQLQTSVPMLLVVVLQV